MHNSPLKTVSTSIDFSSLPQKTDIFEKSHPNFDISSIYLERRNPYLNEFTFFAGYFGYIPNFIPEKYIDCRKANLWFIENYKTEIKDYYYAKRYMKNSKAELDDIFYVLYDDLIVDIDTNNDIVRFLFRKTNITKVEEIINGLKKFKIKKQAHKPEILLIIKEARGLDTKNLAITKPKLSIEENYNDDFSEIHQTILKRLQTKNDKGIVLLHGKPGTGKTSYIRFLITSIKKNVIFLPPNLASDITNPGLISILIDNPNAIFVIEDAENIIIDRETTAHSPVSALLNITDGLLADCSMCKLFVRSIPIFQK